MGFNLREISNFLGRPVCLYEFAWGATFYRYTSANKVVTYNGADYAPIAISDNGFTQGAGQQEFIVTLPRSNPIPELFRSTPPSGKIVLTCRRFHKDDVDEEATVYWIGTVGNIKSKDAITSEVLGLPISSTIRRTGLRLCWEVNCPHALYDAGCKADKELFKVETTITALSAVAFSVASIGAFAGPQFAGGYIEWQATAEGTIDRRAIEAHASGLTFNVLGTTDRLVIGQAITMYLGCDLRAETCDGTFDNLANHGGYRFMSKKSPFDGNPVF